MIEQQLIDQQDKQNYFIFMSNRRINDTFPLLTDDPASMYDRAYKEINMGYSTLMIYERIGILTNDRWYNTNPQNEDEAQSYQNFLFVQPYDKSEFVSYVAFEHDSEYETLHQALSAGKLLLNTKKKRYPNQTFSIVCSAFLKKYAWH